MNPQTRLALVSKISIIKDVSYPSLSKDGNFHQDNIMMTEIKRTHKHDEESTLSN